jgi:hypothetical protein
MTGRPLGAHRDRETTDPAEAPFNPSGTVDAAMAKRMAFATSRGSFPWVEFRAGE